MANPNCQDKESAERAVNEVWESCFNDTRPFDEVCLKLIFNVLSHLYASFLRYINRRPSISWHGYICTATRTGKPCRSSMAVLDIGFRGSISASLVLYLSLYFGVGSENRQLVVGCQEFKSRV
jgi:hypothetical protein